MKWIYLLLALKESNGFTKTPMIIWTVFFDLLALGMFIISLKKFETAFVYMIGAGVSTAMVVNSNYFVFKQQLNWIQITSIILIIMGTVGIQSQNTEH